ncbi:hypothetical protein C4A75_23975 [Brevibacillus laterosporus]|nr:hypothetical protein C4A75_23975 [Brevibacillus laterosporus]
MVTANDTAQPKFQNDGHEHSIREVDTAFINGTTDPLDLLDNKKTCISHNPNRYRFSMVYIALIV